MTAWRKMLMAAAGLATAATVIPTAALADGHGRGHRKHHHRHHYHERVYVEERPVYYRERVYVEERPVYYREAPRYYRDPPRRAYSSCRSGGTTGLIIGGAAGALLGREIDGGRDRTAGTIIGAGAGALLGREIDRTDRC